MIGLWFEEQAVRWLVKRGYLVLRQGAPRLVVAYGTGTFKEFEDGGRLYKILMPPGHKLWVVFNTVITREMT
jgi:hypothetical protein